MKTNVIFFLLLCCAFPVLRLSAQDMIHKNDSTIIESKVIEIGETEIKYKKFSNPDGPTYTVKKSDVAYVVYQNGERETYTVAQPVVASVPFDTLAYLEKMFGAKLQAVTVPDTGCKIIALEQVGIIKSPGLKPPLNDIIQYAGTTSSKDQLRAQGKRIRTTTDFTRAVVHYKQQGAQTIYFLVRYNKRVDHVYSADISGLAFSPVAATQAQQADSLKKKTKPPCPYKKAHLQFEAGIAFRNQFLVGDLNTWFMETNQTPDAGIADGTSSFYYASIGCVFPLNKKHVRPICLGTTLAVDFPRSNPLAWPIQGRVVTYASTSPVNYIRLKPVMAGLAVPVRFPVTNYSAVVVSPALMYAYLTGYSYGATDPDTRSYGGGSNGFGFSCALGIEFFFGPKRMIGATMNTGYRLLETDLNYSANGSAYAPVLFSYGTPVKVDLSGGFLLLGVSLRTNKG